MLKLWVCESCGCTWNTRPEVAPVRDATGEVLCADCALTFARARARDAAADAIATRAEVKITRDGLSSFAPPPIGAQLRAERRNARRREASRA